MMMLEKMCIVGLILVKVASIFLYGVIKSIPSEYTKIRHKTMYLNWEK